jgi:hypothetical protein
MFRDVPYDESTIFVDRPAHVFKHVVGALRDSTYPYSKKYIKELDYFCVRLSGLKVYDPVEEQRAVIRSIVKEEVSIHIPTPACAGYVRETCYVPQKSSCSECSSSCDSD